MSFKVYKEKCSNCLLTKDRIVSPKRAKELIEEIKEEQTYFICHKSSMEGGGVCCKTFYDTMGQVSQQVRIAERLGGEDVGLIEFVELPDNKKLSPYKP